MTEELERVKTALFVANRRNDDLAKENAQMRESLGRKSPLLAQYFQNLDRLNNIVEQYETKFDRVAGLAAKWRGYAENSKPYGREGFMADQLQADADELEAELRADGDPELRRWTAETDAESYKHELVELRKQYFELRRHAMGFAALAYTRHRELGLTETFAMLREAIDHMKPEGVVENFPDPRQAEPEKRAPVQRDTVKMPAGTVSWEEHVRAWTEYAKRYPGQSAERIAERQGFGYNELVMFLGHHPRTWVPR